MVTRRFKKGSVYDALASTSGLDFSPVVQLKTYNSRRDDSSPQMQAPKPPDKSKEKSPKLLHDKSSKDNDVINLNENLKQECADAAQSNLDMNLSEDKQVTPTQKSDEIKKCIAAHEKYPSWPVVNSESSLVSYRSHSWTGQTDYPKEKVSYSRPKKAYQYKISTRQLQPVLERTIDHNNSSKASSESSGSLDTNQSDENYRGAYPSCSSSFRDCNGKQFDFEAFHTPCIPQCYEEKDYVTHSPPERDGASVSNSETESAAKDSYGFHSRYEDVLCHETQYSAPVPVNWNKHGSIESKNEHAAPDTPFLDRLRMENAWQMPPPPVPIHPAAVPQLQQQQQQQQHGNDFEISSENGTWMGSMESSSHGRGIPKWQGSYSDLSTLSTQLSNRSSLFDSGHSTMPESGRLSPQSFCDSTAPSLLLEGPTRAHVVARHGCHREIVAHSARVQQPERHGSESVLYYATGSSCRPKPFDNASKSPPQNQRSSAGANAMTAEEAMFRSHASVTLTPPPKSNMRELNERRVPKSSTSEDLTARSNSLSSEDFPRSRCPLGDEIAGSSSDVSNICLANYKSSNIPHAKSLEKSPSIRDNSKPQNLEPPCPKYKSGYEPPKSKSMDETSRKSIFPEVDKRQRVSDPELKAIQKQAVMSFYQRMSLAESIKSDSKPQLHLPPDTEPPPPYEATPSRMRISAPKLSLLPNKPPKQLPPRCPVPIPPQMDLPGKDSGLLNNYSKSVPNLVILKGQSLDLPPSHPFFKHNGNQRVESDNQLPKKMGSPLAKDEIISWDQLPNVLEKKKEAIEKASPCENKDPPENNKGCTSGLHYLKAPRKVQLKEVHHSNETASVQVLTPEGVTLVQANEKTHKRRPAPPPPPKQPPRRPPPPPPPITPPLTQVIVEGDRIIEQELAASTSSYNEDSPSSPDLPPPPATDDNEVMILCDDPLPPPPDPRDVDVHPRILDGASLIYPKNSYMSYRSEKKLARQGFDGQYRRSFLTSASSIDLTTIDSNCQEGKNSFSPNSWEQIHNIRQHGTTVIFHSDCLQQNSRLERSSSQDCVLAEEAAQNSSDHISNGNDVDNNQPSTSIITQNSETQDTLHRAMPYNSPSQEKTNVETQNSSSNSHPHLHSTKGPACKCPADVTLNCEPASNGFSSLDNDPPTDQNTERGVDHNQNSLQNNETGNSKPLIGNDLISSATQTTDTPKLRRKLVKTQEELECERLSKEFIHFYGDIALKTLLAPNHKTTSDYMEGLLNLELEKSNQPDNLKSVGHFERYDNSQRDEKWKSSSHETKTKNSEVNDNESLDNEAELKKRKEELIESIGKKLESLREDQSIIRSEMLQNDNLGQGIFQRLQELAKPNELEKYALHVEELEKIVNLLLSLSGRLARAENILRNMPKDCSAEEKKILETKCNKLKEQHEDACRLKESIDRRSNQVSTFLHKYFSAEEYAKYDRFIKLKTKFLIDIRELDEKINLGEEQLAALSVVAHQWKSLNS